MTENHSIRSDKEKEAVNLNQKEERMLSKALKTLNLEKSHVLKILNLEKKQVKFSQKRMRDKVKTIRTHLVPEDIATMKTMELEGTFKPEYTPMNASGVIRILAATKRLKLMTNQEISELVEKDLRRPLTTETTTTIPISRPMTPAVSLRMRSRSLPRDLNCSTESRSSYYETKKVSVLKKTGKDIMYDSLDDLHSASGLMMGPDNRTGDIPRDTDRMQARPSSPVREQVNDYMNSEDFVKGPLTTRGRIKSARDTTKQAHAYTTRGFLTSRPSTTNTAVGLGLPPRTPRPRTSLGIQSLNYSSHKVRTNAEDRCRRESVLSTSSIGSEIAREKATEFRKELLADEQFHSACIEDKRQIFLSRIQHWVEDNTNVTAAPVYSPRSRSRSPGKMPDAQDEQLNKSNNCNEWSNMNQCRYLRMTDEEADLSGVTTLVKDQIKQLRLRTGAFV